MTFQPKLNEYCGSLEDMDMMDINYIIDLKKRYDSICKQLSIHFFELIDKINSIINYD